MVKQVLINGCSHSAGSEIEKPGEGESVYNRLNCFGAQFANKLGVPNINLSNPGGSNDYIARSTMFWCLEHPEEVKDTLFLIHWTGPDRSEYFVRDTIHEDDLFWMDEVYDVDVGNISTGEFLWTNYYKDDKKRVKGLSSRLFFSEVHWEINRYLNIIRTQTLLKSLGAKYIFRNAFTQAQKEPRYERYYTKIDESNYPHLFNINESFFEHCLDKGFDIDGQLLHHHKIEAHTYWAEKLYNEHIDKL